MSKPNLLNFKMQAEQMLSIIEGRLDAAQREQALELLVLKFRTLYDQGVGSGRRYEREGVYPYTSLHDDTEF